MSKFRNSERLPAAHRYTPNSGKEPDHVGQTRFNEEVVASLRGISAVVAAGIIGGVNIKTYTAAGVHTWTKPEGLVAALVLQTGGGGEGGAADATAAALVHCAGGGGAGGTTLTLFSAEDLRNQETVTVGAGGTTSTGFPGQSGTATIFTSLLGDVSAGGGAGGVGVNAGAHAIANGGAGGTNSGPHSVSFPGQYGHVGSADVAMPYVAGGHGAGSVWGGGGQAPRRQTAGVSAGGAGLAAGAGGGGAASYDTTNGDFGGDGATGVCIILEFV